MTTLTDEEKVIIRENPIDDLLDSIRRKPSKFTCTPTLSFEDIINSASEDIDVFKSIREILHILQGLPAAWELPSRSRTFDTSPRMLFEDIQDLIAHFHATMQLDAELAAVVLEAVIKGKLGNDEMIWIAIYDLVSRPTIAVPQSRGSSPIMDSSGVLLNNLRGDWNRGYFPGSLEVLQQQVRRRGLEYYSKTLVFLQSSGMGKSRLADAFGKSCPMISFNLRREGTTGYPPSDIEILHFVHQKPTETDYKLMTTAKAPNVNYPEKREDNMWNHSIVAALLRASFEHLNAWVEEHRHAKMTPLQLAATRHAEMAPVRDGVWDARSVERIRYCNSVTTTAAGYILDLVTKETWRTIFGKDDKSDIRTGLLRSGCLRDLIRAVERLLRNLHEFAEKGEQRKPSLVVVFDEASSFLFRGDDSGKPQMGLYVALNRIFSCLREWDVWFFILSTESKVESLLPPEKVDPGDRDASSRLGDENKKAPLQIFPPFVALQLDVEDRRVMQSEQTKRAELLKTMTEFSKLRHMKIFGRPLWFAYSDADEMVELARFKLIGGKKGPYDPTNVDQVFAALSFRISLDLCLENPRALALARTAVNYHMRVVIKVHQDIEALDTITPSEPVVSEAAIRCLCEQKHSGERRKDGSEDSGMFEGGIPKLKWGTTVKTLARKLLQDGVIQKGTKGELYSRLLLILARDCVHLNDKYALKPTGPFTVLEFLKALFAEEHHESIHAIQPQILGALMNFTHFTSTEENLHLDDTSELCHDLLRRSAALQLAQNQPTYDHLIPIYFGTADETFEPSKCGVILVQVKNKKKATTLFDIFREKFDYVGPGTGAKLVPEVAPEEEPENTKHPLRKTKYFCFDKMVNPILFLLLDLGIGGCDSGVQVSHSNSKAVPCLWAINSHGHGPKTFGCPKSMGCTEACRLFFVTAAPGRTDHDKLSDRNKVFGQLHRKFRYSIKHKADATGEIATANDAGTGIEDRDGDVRMADF